MTTEANADNVEGYLDGSDPNSPEPSANRSASYRHSFAVARADRAHMPAFGSAARARELAEKAQAEDES